VFEEMLHTVLPQSQYKDDGRKGPTLRKLIASGERRLERLNEVISKELGSPGSLNFDRAERLFVQAGIKALELVHAFTTPELSPVVALQDLLGELEQLGLINAGHARLDRIVARARLIIRELGERPE